MKAIRSADGKHEVEIKADGGFFRFTELCELWQESDAYQAGFHYWAPTYFSGLYDSAEAAETDAHLMLAWLRDETI